MKKYLSKESSTRLSVAMMYMDILMYALALQLACFSDTVSPSNHWPLEQVSIAKGITKRTIIRLDTSMLVRNTVEGCFQVFIWHIVSMSTNEFVMSPPIISILITAASRGPLIPPLRVKLLSLSSIDSLTLASSCC